MRNRRWTLIAGMVLGLTLAAFEAPAQTTTTVPRTSDGRPDLQGVWNFATLTPLQRPPQHAEKPFLTAEEAAEYAEQTLREQNTDRPFPPGPVSTRTFSQLAFNEFWWERPRSLAVIAGRIRSSLIVDPPDGKLPAFTAEADDRRTRQTQIMNANIADDPEQRLLSERCLSTHGGPPMLPGAETSFVQIVQTTDYVVIAAEASNARIASLDRRPHLPASMKTWRGDSRGRWEQDTLIVDTMNMRVNATLTTAPGSWSDATFHLVERFTMADADTLLYEFTVDAPRIFVQPWTAIVPLRRTTSRMFEYACHEGNYGFENILRGARAQER